MAKVQKNCVLTQPNIEHSQLKLVSFETPFPARLARITGGFHLAIKFHWI